MFEKISKSIISKTIFYCFFLFSTFVISRYMIVDRDIYTYLSQWLINNEVLYFVNILIFMTLPNLVIFRRKLVGFIYMLIFVVAFFLAYESLNLTTYNFLDNIYENYIFLSSYRIFLLILFISLLGFSIGLLKVSTESIISRMYVNIYLSFLCVLVLLNTLAVFSNVFHVNLGVSFIFSYPYYDFTNVIIDMIQQDLLIYIVFSIMFIWFNNRVFAKLKFTKSFNRKRKMEMIFLLFLFLGFERVMIGTKLWITNLRLMTVSCIVSLLTYGIKFEFIRSPMFSVFVIALVTINCFTFLMSVFEIIRYPNNELSTI